VAHRLNKVVNILKNSLKNLEMGLFFGKNIKTIEMIPRYAKAIASKSSL
jgi:hypothetical protein